MDYIKGRVSLPALTVEKRWAFPVFVSSLLCSFLLLTTLNMNLLTSLSSLNAVLFATSAMDTGGAGVTPVFDEPAPSPASQPPPPPLPPPAAKVPRLAYFISGSSGDLDRLWRTLHALYHPHNFYALHLDLESPAAERQNLAARAANHSLFAMVGNVHVISKSNMVTYRGSTMVANTLHACAILLKKSGEWDWFINLSAADYPLVTQDDLLSAFSKLPKNLNFVEHTSRLGWKEKQRARPVIIDPGLYRTTKSEVFWANQQRELPNSFKLFTGSAWVVLTREFVEFCVWGWDNLPRTVLMYYANFLSAPEGYFHTVICNALEFSATVVNHDLHYISWDAPPKQHPRSLSVNDTAAMVRSSAPFARKFDENDPALDVIDATLLGRRGNGVTPGGWCSGTPLCSNVSDGAGLRPGPGSKRLARLMDRMVLSGEFLLRQCKNI